MKRILLCAVFGLGMVLGAPAFAEDVVTLYAADGLHDGKPNWAQTQFDEFTKQTGIKVQYVEGGSGGVVERISKESTNPQADVLVTLPPFIMKAAADGLLQPYTPAGADQIDATQRDKGGMYVALCYNFMNFIYNSSLGEPPKTFEDLLNPKFKSKLQYSTPGQAGDGTAVMIQIIHAYGSKEKGFEFFKKLQANNVGPSASTGKLTALVNKGELFIANGDMQMNVNQIKTNPNVRIFWPAGPDGKRSTFALPYYVGLVKGAPHAAAGKKLIDFLLSKGPQSTLTSLANGLPVRKDVTPTDENFTQFHKLMEGVTVWTPDWTKVLAELKDDAAKWREVTGN